jgi:hypothetical protein
MDGDLEYVVTVEIFVLGNNRHPDFDMPTLRRPSNEEEIPIYLTTTPQDVLFCLSVQHDCRLSGCSESGFRVVRQEHQDTSRQMSVLAHNDDTNFIINTHALHNATLLDRLLPRSLTEPKPLHADRQSFHLAVVQKYRVTQELKRKATNDKCKATREANKEAGAQNGVLSGGNLEVQDAQETRNPGSESSGSNTKKRKR